MVQNHEEEAVRIQKPRAIKNCEKFCRRRLCQRPLQPRRAEFMDMANGQWIVVNEDSNPEP